MYRFRLYTIMNSLSICQCIILSTKRWSFFSADSCANLDRRAGGRVLYIRETKAVRSDRMPFIFVLPALTAALTLLLWTWPGGAQVVRPTVDGGPSSSAQ